MLGSGRNPAVLRRPDGADEESSRRVVEGDGQEDHVVGGRGDHWSERTMRRWRERLEKDGYTGLADRRKGKPSAQRIPLATAEEVLRLYREEYFRASLGAVY